MDPFIRVPPHHYGGIERVIADLADGLRPAGHDVTLWAAPGSRVNGQVEPYGHEGEWTRWSNIRNTRHACRPLPEAGRALRRRAQLRPARVSRAGAGARPAEGADLHADRESRQHGDGAPAGSTAAALHGRQRRHP